MAMLIIGSQRHPDLNSLAAMSPFLYSDRKHQVALGYQSRR